MVVTAALFMLERAQEVSSQPLTIWYFGPDGHGQAMKNFDSEGMTIYLMAPSTWFKYETGERPQYRRGVSGPWQPVGEA